MFQCLVHLDWHFVTCISITLVVECQFWVSTFTKLGWLLPLLFEMEHCRGDKSKYWLKYGFCNKSFRKDEPMTSWTLFSTYLSSKLCSPLIKTLERIRSSSGEGESLLMINMWKKVFNWSEVHLSEMTCYKIHTLVSMNRLFTIDNPQPKSC